MIRFTRSQLQPIAVDIGHDSIRMLQLEAAGDGLVVRAAAQHALPAADPAERTEAAAGLVRRLLAQNPFSGRLAVAALPREITQVRSLRLPAMPPAELEAAALIEARQLLGFDPEEGQVRCLPAGEVRQGNDVLQEVIVVAARDSDIAEHIERFHRTGLVLASLDIEPAALFRSVERFIRRREDELEVHVLADIGLMGTQVVIGRGREISFLKTIDIGGRHFRDAVAEKLAISPDEAQALRRRLADAPEPADARRDPVRQAVIDATRSLTEQLGRELSLCLRYQQVTFRGHRPARVRLLGGEGRDPQLQAALSGILPVPVEHGRPLCNVDSSRMRCQDRRNPTSEWAMALGLGLRLVDQHFGARDGRPRSAAPAPSPTDEPASAEEVAHA